MSLRLLNSLGGKTAEFQPLEPGKVRMYHCGPTVKAPAHIGKFRSFLLADLLRRHLERSGFEVRQVMNITDVGHLNEFDEDIVEMAAARSGLYAWELVEEEEKKFHEERRALRILDAHEYPHARDHVGEMIDLVRDLEAKGVCYTAGGNVYLDISGFSGFGKLSGKSLAELTELQKSSRAAAAPRKRHPLDIDLWRTDALHQMLWDSPWGKGFPGWHVECAAMSRKYLGGSFDIHTGTDDILFPHHECEIAQVETLTGKPLASCWLHTGPVQVDGQPMLRQNANVVTVRELLDSGIPGVVVRVALLGTHYRESLDFGEAPLEWAQRSVAAVRAFHAHLEGAAKTAGPAAGEPPAAWITETDARFQEALDRDLDYPAALEAILEAQDRLEPEDIGNPRPAREAVESWDRVLGILEE